MRIKRSASFVTESCRRSEVPGPLPLGYAWRLGGFSRSRRGWGMHPIRASTTRAGHKTPTVDLTDVGVELLAALRTSDLDGQSVRVFFSSHPEFPPFNEPRYREHCSRSLDIRHAQSLRSGRITDTTACEEPHRNPLSALNVYAFAYVMPMECEAGIFKTLALQQSRLDMCMACRL